VETSNVVFVLDGDRRHSITRGFDDARVDNRYPMTAADLPSLRVLRAAGIQRVIKVAGVRTSPTQA
jgi:hypothetical protein